MANLIEATKIEGASVYGVAQMSYAVDGVSGQDYAAALSAASFRDAVAIEKSLSGYSEVVRQRMRKIEDLGSVMAALNAAASTLKVKDTESGDRTDAMSQIYEAHSLASKYGISLGWVAISGDTMQMTRAQVYKGQNEVQYAIDKEDNDLKQDMVSLNSFISKRDNAFSAASKLVKKVSDAAGNTISNIGG